MVLLRSSYNSYSIKKAFLKISQNSQESTFDFFFNKVVGLRPAILLKRDSGTGVFT